MAIRKVRVGDLVRSPPGSHCVWMVVARPKPGSDLFEAVQLPERYRHPGHHRLVLSLHESERITKATCLDEIVWHYMNIANASDHWTPYTARRAAGQEVAALLANTRG